MKVKDTSYKYIILGISIILIITMFFTGRYKKRFSFFGDTLGIVVSPIQDGISNVDYYIKEKLSKYSTSIDIREENETLKDRVRELEYENEILEQMKSENDKLRELLSLSKMYSEFPQEGADVIGKDPGNWFNVFLVDKGRKDGIELNMVVISGNGLVGHIVDVGYNYSKVLSIIDDRSAVSSKIARSGDLGIVKGDKLLLNDGLIKMSYLDMNTDIVIGDEIDTSSLGQIYPPNINIGIVKEIESESKALTKYALIEPSVDFKHLEHVIILKTVWNKLEE